MKLMKLWRKRGQVEAKTIAIVAISTLLAITIIAITVPAITSITLSSDIERLTSQGYVVLAEGEYDSISDKLDALKVSADAAVVNAEAAALASQATLDKLELHTENEVYLYPDVSNVTVTLTAGGVANTFGSWVEITDSGATTLSSKFAANSGYLREVMTHDYSIADKIFIVEIAYGASKDIVGRIKVRSDWTYVMVLNSVVIPAGETVYYRMMSETADATFKADFRYYYN